MRRNPQVRARPKAAADAANMPRRGGPYWDPAKVTAPTLRWWQVWDATHRPPWRRRSSPCWRTGPASGWCCWARHHYAADGAQSRRCSPPCRPFSRKPRLTRRPEPCGRRHRLLSPRDPRGRPSLCPASRLPPARAGGSCRGRNAAGAGRRERGWRGGCAHARPSRRAVEMTAHEAVLRPGKAWRAQPGPSRRGDAVTARRHDLRPCQPGHRRRLHHGPGRRRAGQAGGRLNALMPAGTSPRRVPGRRVGGPLPLWRGGGAKVRAVIGGPAKAGSGRRGARPPVFMPGPRHPPGFRHAPRMGRPGTGMLAAGRPAPRDLRKRGTGGAARLTAAARPTQASRNVEGEAPWRNRTRPDAPSGCAASAGSTTPPTPA